MAGGTSLTTHLAKAGSRLVVNFSPEPVSNITASVAEDGLVLGGLGLMAFAPIPSFFFFLIVLFVAGWLVWKSSSLFQRGWQKLRGKSETSAA